MPAVVALAFVLLFDVAWRGGCGAKRGSQKPTIHGIAPPIVKKKPKTFILRGGKVRIGFRFAKSCIVAQRVEKVGVNLEKMCLDRHHDLPPKNKTVSCGAVQ